MPIACSPFLVSEDVEAPAGLDSTTSAAIDKLVPATSAALPTKTSRRDISRSAIGACLTLGLFICNFLWLLRDLCEAPNFAGRTAHQPAKEAETTRRHSSEIE